MRFYKLKDQNRLLEKVEDQNQISKTLETKIEINESSSTKTIYKTFNQVYSGWVGVINRWKMHSFQLSLKALEFIVSSFLPQNVCVSKKLICWSSEFSLLRSLYHVLYYFLVSFLWYRDYTSVLCNAPLTIITCHIAVYSCCDEKEALSAILNTPGNFHVAILEVWLILRIELCI